MIKAVIGPDGRILKDLYYIEDPDNLPEALFLMSEDYCAMPFIDFSGRGWTLSNEVILKTKKNFDTTTFSRLTRGWYAGDTSLAQGYSFVDVGMFSLGEIK